MQQYIQHLEIENNRECFVRLWRRLERTRQLLWQQHKRFCMRRILQSWMGRVGTDELLWEVCMLMQLVLDDEDAVYGYDELPPPSLSPRRHREFLRALVAVKLGIGIRAVDLKALDAAYSEVFPDSTPINVNKKARTKVK